DYDPAALAPGRAGRRSAVARLPANRSPGAGLTGGGFSTSLLWSRLTPLRLRLRAIRRLRAWLGVGIAAGSGQCLQRVLLFNARSRNLPVDSGSAQRREHILAAQALLLGDLVDALLQDSSERTPSESSPAASDSSDDLTPTGAVSSGVSSSAGAGSSGP